MLFRVLSIVSKVKSVIGLDSLWMRGGAITPSSLRDR